jgi:c-di-GMP-binding flagellar brake protein YcgR
MLAAAPTGSDRTDTYLNPTSEGILLALALLAGVLIAFLITYAVYDRRTRMRVLEERWNVFRRLCKDRALTRDEVALLRRLQQAAVPDRPHLLVTSLNFYDGCVEEEIRRAEAEGLPFDERSDAANAFVNIREKLFFGEPMSKSRLGSTLDLEPHQQLRIEIPGRPGTWSSTVMSASDSSLTISMPARRGETAALSRGDRLVVYFSIRNDAGYRFESAVAGIRDSRMPAVHIWHTDKLERQQLRTWMRMSMEVPCRFYRIRFPDLQPDESGMVPPDKYPTATHEGLFSGMLRDFSLGGVCLRSEAMLASGEYAGVLIPIFGQQGDQPEEELEILGKVVGSTELETVRNQVFNMHIQFVPLDNDTRGVLMANMFQLQRRLGRKAH